MPIGTDDPALGGKAHGLALAAARGHAVPDGFVVPDGDDGPLPPLGPGPYVVRSSASVEDRAGAAAPGIFLSVRDVRPEGVADAIRAVRASLGSETARAYLGLRKLGAATMSVIVQEQKAGVLVTAYSRAPGDPGGVLVESLEGGAALVHGDEVTGALEGVPSEIIRQMAAIARDLEEGLGAPADVELVYDGRPWVVQARAVPPAAAREVSVGADELAAALAFSRAEPDVVWSWDAGHNPSPLTPAQAGLVELVEAAGAASVRQRVVLGYLYFTRTGAPPPLRRIEEGELSAVYERELAPAFASALGRMGTDLETTLAAYLEVYRLYARVLAPSLRGARPIPIRRPELGDDEVSAAWDVGAPTYSAGRFRVPATLQDLDDFVFARAQMGVRRALATLAAGWATTANDLALLPLDAVRAAARVGSLPDGASASIERARRELARLSAFAPPLQILNGRGIFRPPARGEGVLRGRGTGGRARGPVLRLDASSPRPAAGHVLVCAAALPTLAPLLDGVLALVVENEGLLGHGAALARELGIPCVVGCVGALTALRDGEVVWVDADAGVVVSL